MNILKKWLTNQNTKSINYTIFQDLPELNIHTIYDNANNLYSDNPIIHRCIRLIADHGAHLALDSYRYGKLVKDSKFLRFLNSPNITQDSSAFFDEAIVTDRLYGNIYMKATLDNDDITSLSIIPNANIKVSTDKNGKIVYTESIGVQQKQYRYDLLTGEIRNANTLLIHIKNHNPDNPLQGISPLRSCGLVGELFGRGIAWNLSLIKNSAKPSGILKTNEMLPAEQYHRLKDKFYELFQGWDNSGKIPVLENGLEFQAIGLTPVDMDFLDLMRFAREIIASAYSIPLPLISSDSSTYNNISESKKALYHDAVLPVMNRIINAMNKSLSKYLNGEKLGINLDSIHGIGEDRAAAFDNMIKAVQAGILTPLQARQELGYVS